MANTSTSIDLFVKRLKNSKMDTVRDSRYKSKFDCGSFMRGISPKESNHKECILYSYQGELSEKEIVWWFERLKDLDIEATYFGKENGRDVYLYKLEDSFSSMYRLLRFTMVRYAWSTPFTSLVKRMFKVDNNDEFEGIDFWTVFMAYHAVLSKNQYYDATFGLTSAGSYRPETNESMINKFTVKRVGIAASSINNLFLGDGFGVKTTESLDFNDIKLVNRLLSNGKKEK